MSNVSAQARSPAAKRKRRLRARRRRRVVYVAPLEITALHLSLLYAARLIDQRQKSDWAAVARVVERLLVETLSPETAPRLARGAI